MHIQLKLVTYSTQAIMNIRKEITLAHKQLTNTKTLQQVRSRVDLLDSKLPCLIIKFTMTQKITIQYHQVHWLKQRLKRLTKSHCKATLCESANQKVKLTLGTCVTVVGFVCLSVCLSVCLLLYISLLECLLVSKTIPSTKFAIEVN